MATLVDFVIDDVSRPVLDKTGFEQPFNFVLEFTPNVAVSDYLGPSTLPDGPSAAPVAAVGELASKPESQTPRGVRTSAGGERLSGHEECALGFPVSSASVDPPIQSR